jgi:endonuclease YncB( thermonuclease family)
MARGWLLVLMAVAAPVFGADFRGTVTHVTDGDTVWVRREADGGSVEIRLLDLDAPEGCQSFGAESRKALAGRVLRQPVRVRTRGTDDYGRALARVEHRGEDVGAWMVRNGNAWSMSFRGKAGPYARLEEQAQRAHRGLWSLPGAMDPRSFRKRNGQCR